jgi:Xaa-Pro dipeptidase
VLGLSERMLVTRRWFYLIPANGEPQGLVHRIESHHLDALPGGKLQYSSWTELSGSLKALLSPYKNVAMQYSSGNVLPLIGMVDAGTIELVRSFGVNVVTSADLVSGFEATLSEDQIAGHFAAGGAIDGITKAAFKEIGRAARNGGTNEYQIQQWILEAFRREGIVTEEHSGLRVQFLAWNL